MDITSAQSIAILAILSERRKLLSSELRVIEGLPDGPETHSIVQSRAIELGIQTRSISAALKKCEGYIKLGIQAIPIFSAGYPAVLRAISDPPLVLFVRGDIGVLSAVPGVAIVGTRKASEFGKQFASRISKHLAGKGWMVVSGLALGIDAAAHRGCIEASGKTVAVLAHGLEAAQPRQNAGLADEILATGGAWVSEHPIGAPARRENFVPRNRIQIGLSAGSVIVEASLRGGSMRQADFCVAESRPLFAVVPHLKDNPLGLVADGTVELVRRGMAIPVASRDDLPMLEERLSLQREKLAGLLK